MRHTDFFTLVQEIKRREYQELWDAINIHGGSYKFDLTKDGCFPIIAVNVDSIMPHPCDVRISGVFIRNGELYISGVDNEFGNPVEIIPQCAFAGHLSSIIDYLPEIKYLQS